jgi:ABC transporter substrate binding protein
VTCLADRPLLQARRPEAPPCARAPRPLFAAIPNAIAARGAFVDKVLNGQHVGYLPVEQPAIFDLVVNLRTAKTLGIGIPETVLVGSDEVIE